MSYIENTYESYLKAINDAKDVGERNKILVGIGISNPKRLSDLKSYIPLLLRGNNRDLDNLTDQEILSKLSSSDRRQANSMNTRTALISFVKNKLNNNTNNSNSSNSSNSNSNNSNNTNNVEYEKCLVQAKKRKQAGKLKLCPEGYCTAKAKFEVYPSAYANAFAAQVCKGTQADLEGKMKNHYGDTAKPADSELSRWFKEKWVNVCEPGYPPCGRSKADLKAENYPYCRPLNKLPGTQVKTVSELSETEISQMCTKKRSLEQGVEGKPTRVYL